MSLQEKKYYDSLRKQLPARYAKLVAQKAGEGITEDKVHNVFNLRVKDEIVIMSVVVAARQVAKEHQAKKRMLKKQLANL